jgi:hypothetical protein
MVSGERSLSNVGQNMGKKANGPGALPNFSKPGGAVGGGGGNKKQN